MTRKITILTCLSIGVVYLLMGLRYPVGTTANPGPGLYPLFVGGLLLVSSVAGGLEVFRANARQRESTPLWGKHAWRLVTIVLTMSVYIIILPYAGHMFGGIIVTFAALQVVGGIKWYTKLILTLLIPVGSFLLFDTILGVSLPKGILFG